MFLFKFPAGSFRKSIFVRLVVMYLIVVLPVITLGMYLYNWSYSNATQNLSRAALAQLSNYLEDLSREIEWMESQQYDILEDNDLNKLAVTWELMDSVEKRSNLNYLVHRLTAIKNSSNFIQDIDVHIPSINKTISASNAVIGFDRESFDYFRAVGGRNGNRLILRNGTLHLIAMKQSGKKGEEPLFIVEIELDTSKLRDSLQQVSTYPGSRSFLIAETSGFTLGSDEDLEQMLQYDYLRSIMKKSSNPSVFRVNGRKYHLDEVRSDQLNLAVATYLPEEAVKKPLSRFQIWAWLFALTSICAIVIYSLSTYRLVHKPLLLLIQGFRRMEGGSLDIQIEHEQEDEFGYLYHRFNHMTRRLQALIDQDFKQKLMMQKAELKQLQSQINPHFLYNSFFILNSLAKTGDTERIELFTHMLGEYFRFITRNGEDNVRLADEIKHSRMYTEIQKLRFSRRIRVQFDELPKELETIRVPRLIVQPLIENAYEHSLEKMMKEGMLRVTFEKDPAEARIVVEDNGEGLGDADIAALNERLANPSESQDMTGMINIHRRILLIYGAGSGLFLSKSEWNGLKVEVRIKLEGESGHVSAVNC
ncbi:sensor histidine kinase [Paenibacillus humicola]|uniref:sensor histidine kinase n=1 Tax=Paenibacillus humicola TaxID=3110540 RepID=UPI00237BE5FE|nr:histidine kinase [Paenibacillus humicola]